MHPARPDRILRRGIALLAVILIGGLIGAPAAATAAAGVSANAPAAAPAMAATTAPRPLTVDQFAHRLSAEVYGFLPYWELDSTVDAYLDYDLLTDIALFSVGVNDDGTIDTGARGYATVTGDLAAAIVAHAHAAGVRVDLTLTSFGLAKNAAFFTDAAAQATAVSAIAALVATRGLDGVNVDVELLSGTEFAAYGAFVGSLRTALRAANPAARVSVSTNGSTSGANMAAVAIANGADRAFLMGYAYRSAGTSPVGSIAPLDRTDGGKSLTTSLALYADSGVPAGRTLMGLPYFGRTWPTASGALHADATGPGAVFFPDSGVPAIPAGTSIAYDPVEVSAWFAVLDAATGTWTQTYFDDPATLRQKYAAAARAGLAGIGLWTLGYDRGVPGYWEAIRSSFGAVRLAGADRYETAAAVAAATFAPGVPTAYIATGTNFPDGLAAAAVAGHAGSPVLLVRRDSIPPATAAELARLRPLSIVVLGSAATVSDAVMASLGGYASGGVTRIAGRDRFETAAALSRASYPGGAPVAYLVSGLDFPDAVSAAPAAGRDGGPVLLSRPDRLTDATSAELARLAPAKVVVVGGPSVVSDAVIAQVKAVVPGVAVIRLAGKDRYATAAAVAATFNAGVPAVFLATGLDFPDALAGAAAAVATGGPMALTGPNALPPSVLAQLERLGADRAAIVGGPSRVSDAVIVAVRATLGGP
jgi:putative cell wall-binding protein